MALVSIHAPREGCDNRARSNLRPIDVSIHAPREGCDGLTIETTKRPTRFNSRTPGGVRRAAPSLTAIPGAFQFTHPGRGATYSSYRFTREEKVSIHAPREGCDPRFMLSDETNIQFQFTHPGRGATGSALSCCPSHSGFNSRTPGGVRHPYE